MRLAIENTIHMVIINPYPFSVLFRRGESHQIIVVEILVGKRYQRFVATSIMPAETELRKTRTA